MFRRPAVAILAIVDLLPVPLSRPFVLQTGAVGDDAFVLPAGTVTFLLTDIEGSSRLWEDRADDMPVAIARHYAILDEAIAAHDGVRPVEQGEGDSIVAAFARAGDAVRAAVDAQRRLVAEVPWLKVRMALYTGEAQLRDEGNYIGRALNRCARLRSCGHGGQVLLSASTAALVADDAPGVELRDLGVVRLRDLLRPERVSQVVADGLPDAFPPLRSLDAAPHNLPSALTTFIGREHELGVVTGLVRTERLVTLTGSGGCGKTRLALHAAAEVVDAHTGGTWWVDLAPAVDGLGVLERASTAVGVTAPPGADPVVLLTRHLRELGPTLLVLDNAEHVVADVARLVDAIVSGCPEARVVVTSREPLGIPGEIVWRVPSLTAPARDEHVTLERLDAYEAARLFLDRARRVRPNLAVDDRAVASIVAICSRLDGIPLALELAAARARTVPLQRLAAGLDDAFRMLTGGARTAMPRQQTLLASIGWSVDLLDDRERAVLRRLAVFQGPFELEAAEAVAGGDELVDPYDVLDVLGRLVDKSLVQFDEATGRYRLLETIRQFSLDRLREAKEIVPTRNRHARWFAGWCESLGRGEHDFGIQTSHPALADVFAALEWSYASDAPSAYLIFRGLGKIWSFIGHFREFDAALRWLREQPDDGPDWADAVAALSVTAYPLRRPMDDMIERAAPVASPLGQRLLRFVPSVVRSLAGDNAPLEQLLADAVDAGDDQLSRAVAHAIANTYSLLGDFERAAAAIKVTEEILERRGLPFTTATALANFGIKVLILRETGRLFEASELARNSGGGNGTQVFIVAGVVGQLAYALGDRELHDFVLCLQRPGEAAARAALAAGSIGSVEFSMLVTHCSDALLDRRYGDALELLRRAYRAKTASPAVVSMRLVLLGNRLLHVRAYEELAPLVDELEVDIERVGDAPRSRTDLHQLRALQARFRGELDVAAHEAHAALELAQQHGYKLLAIDALHLLQLLAHERGQVPLSARLAGAVAAERARIGYVARVVPDPEALEALDAELADRHPALWAEGAALGFDEAIEYASRSRGERDRPTVGWESLTPTEARVAALVADGLSNDEVAKRLLMGVATVKTHLTRIYAKTGAANRAQLAARHPEPTA